MHAIDSGAESTRARERANIMFAIAASADILKTVFILEIMFKVLMALLATNTSAVNTASLAMTTLQTGNRPSD